MNSRRSQALRLRQQELLLRSQVLRIDLAQQAAVFSRPLAVADQLRDGWHWLRAHPLLPTAAAVALVVVRPRRAWRLGLRLWWGWNLWQRLQKRLAPAR